MKVPATQLKDVVKVLGTVKVDSLIFAGSLAYAVGMNITVGVICPDMGTFGVSAEKFSQIAGRLDDEIDISLLNGLGKVETNPELISKLQLKRKQSKLTIPILAAPQIPKITLPLNAVCVLDTKQFNEMVNYAASASESGQQFSYTGSVLLSSSGQTLSAYGTDGKRMGIVDTPSAASPFSFIMPVQVIQATKALRGDVVTIYQDATNLYFKSGPAIIVARQLAKEFPNCNSIIPKTFSIISKIAAQDMKEALRRIEPIVDKENDRITLTIGSTNVILNAVGNNGSGEDAIPAISIESDPLFDTFKFGIKLHQLQEFFNEVSGDVLLNANSEGQPIYLEAGAKRLLCASLKT
jgi:DNA polymerase III sliding clamp (beta) subunit (PCNA family)